MLPVVWICRNWSFLHCDSSLISVIFILYTNIFYKTKPIMCKIMMHQSQGKGRYHISSMFVLNHMPCVSALCRADPQGFQVFQPHQTGSQDSSPRVPHEWGTLCSGLKIACSSQLLGKEQTQVWNPNHHHWCPRHRIKPLLSQIAWLGRPDPRQALNCKDHWACLVPVLKGTF